MTTKDDNNDDAGFINMHKSDNNIDSVRETENRRERIMFLCLGYFFLLLHKTYVVDTH